MNIAALEFWVEDTKRVSDKEPKELTVLDLGYLALGSEGEWARRNWLRHVGPTPLASKLLSEVRYEDLVAFDQSFLTRDSTRPKQSLQDLISRLLKKVFREAEKRGIEVNSDVRGAEYPYREKAPLSERLENLQELVGPSQKWEPPLRSRQKLFSEVSEKIRPGAYIWDHRTNSARRVSKVWGESILLEGGGKSVALVTLCGSQYEILDFVPEGLVQTSESPTPRSKRPK